MNKNDIRKYYKAERILLNQEEISRLSGKILNKLKSNFQFEGKNVHTFYSISNQKEIEMENINEFLMNNAESIATSITQFNPLQLIHSKIEKTTIFHVDKYNIPIPTSIIPINIEKLDVVLIPLLAFDELGNRVGYGKGLYDSFLVKCKPECIKIGVSFFEHIAPQIPSESHDIKLDYCVTPNKIYCF